MNQAAPQPRQALLAVLLVLVIIGAIVGALMLVKPSAQAVARCPEQVNSEAIAELRGQLKALREDIVELRAQRCAAAQP